MRKDLPHRFEGDEILSRLLAQSGCPYSLEDVVFEFRAALEEDPETSPAEIIPLLFEDEPRFGSPEEAGRLYANLLGLWDRLARQGAGPLAVLDDEAPEVFPEAPEGAAEGPVVPTDYVTWASRSLLEGSERERRRAEDRLENRQAALVDFVRRSLAECSPEAEETAVGLCVVTHEAFLRAFGREALEAVAYKDADAALRAVRAGGAGEPQPPLAAYHEDTLDAAEEAEEDPLPSDERPLVAEVLAAVRAALTGRLRLQRGPEGP